uniref:DNA-directed DNA polymerase n=1 Tax=Chrysodeixis includens nucleopolyhedrovirus TaxID=1207438 RepID=A0A6B9CQ04_9ABAC|nr:DNA polymerase [Chrysodeixis includens nucleopolyhedrovirus]
MMLSLLKYEELERAVMSTWIQGNAKILPSDVYRITRMMYKENRLLIFFTGHNNNQPYQFYMDSLCDLFSYRKCFNNHAFSKCYNGCESYKTMVMPGLRGVNSERINVIKYKRCRDNEQYDKYCLDSFLNDINRVHMQTKLKEGQYVRFKKVLPCIKNRLQYPNNKIDNIDQLLEIVSPDSLTREIVPVIACYDIETHSNGQRFSTPEEDFIISISIVVKRDNKNTKICLYYIENNENDMQNVDNNLTAEIMCVRFKNEINMLKAFFKLLPAINMDCLLDYNGDKFDLPFIINRARILSSRQHSRQYSVGLITSETWTKIIRYDLEPISIRTSQLCDKFGNRMNTHFFSYYTHVDLYQFLSTDSEQTNVENFQLNTVAEHYLNQKKVDLPIAEMLNLYNNNCLKKLIEYNVQDSVLPIDIFLKLEIMDFMYTLCMLLYLSTDDVLRNISHKVSVVFFYRALNNTHYDERLKREIADAYFFNKADLSVTSGRKRVWRQREDDSNQSNNEVVDSQMVDLTLLQRTPIEDIPEDAVRLCHQKQKCIYKGGKVLSPQPGLKRWVATLDFNSLYLTIMIQEGICLSNTFIGHDNYVYLMKNQNAINPKLLRQLLELRILYKTKRDKFDVGTFQYNLYDKTQNAVKRIANSIYGYFGIFFKPLANYVTKIGREKLMEAIKKIQNMSDDPRILNDFNLSSIVFKVIYGDTDSSFIHVAFDENEIKENVYETIGKIINNYVLDKLNADWVGYKMALENIMTSLILLKKKKYCYLNSENRIKYKGWLIKKDMPLFMRKVFRQVVDTYLRNHSVACGLQLLTELMIAHYDNFGNNDNYSDYGFSMSYNENTTNKKKKESAPGAPERKRPITIAKHCREILANCGTDFLPGNGDRIPYLLTDVAGSVTQKAFPLKLFDQTKRMSWIKHMGIVCTFMNELIQIFGDRPEFEYYFTKICQHYMQNQQHDVKFPQLKPVKHAVKKPKKTTVTTKDDEYNDDDEDGYNSDDKDESDNDDDDESIAINYQYQFFLYKKRPAPKLTKSKKAVASKTVDDDVSTTYKPNKLCGECNKIC